LILKLWSYDIDCKLEKNIGKWKKYKISDFEKLFMKEENKENEYRK